MAPYRAHAPLVAWLLLLAPLGETASDGTVIISPVPATPIDDSDAPQCAPENVVRACIMSDRPTHLAAVIHSVLDSAALNSCVQWEVFTTEDVELEVSRALDNEPLLAPPSRHAARVTTLIEAEAALEERGITPVWTRPAFLRAAGGTPRRTLWSLREPPSDSDKKHSHPLNLLRFYLAELPSLQGASRVLLFDDDVCVRRDVGDLFRMPISGDDDTVDSDTPLLMASCQMQQFEPSEGLFRIHDAHYTYADTRFLGTIGGPSGYNLCPEDLSELEEEAELDDPDCDPKERAERLRRRTCAPAALEPKLTQLHAEISGRSTFRNETAWNFGVTLVHLERWRNTGVSRHIDRWFLANEHFAFFAPNSMSFGLGLAYLAFAGRVDCWPAKTIIDGLGFLNWHDFRANGIGEDEIKVSARQPARTFFRHSNCTMVFSPPRQFTYASAPAPSFANRMLRFYILRVGASQSQQCRPSAPLRKSSPISLRRARNRGCVACRMLVAMVRVRPPHRRRRRRRRRRRPRHRRCRRRRPPRRRLLRLHQSELRARRARGATAPARCCTTWQVPQTSSAT